MSDALSKALWVELPKPEVTPEDRVARALQRALDNTRPDHAGTPWDGESEVVRDDRGYLIPGGE